MTGRDGDRRRTLRDAALVGLVGGGGATFVLGAITLGTGALLGRIPLILGLLLVLGLLVMTAGLVVTLATLRIDRRRGGRSRTEPEG